MPNQNNSSVAKWQIYNAGQTLGKIGSEDGIIIEDEEFHNEARITVENEARKIPFAITFGVYGLLLHTIYTDSYETVLDIIKQLKVDIELIVKARKENPFEAQELGQKLIKMHSSQR